MELTSPSFSTLKINTKRGNILVDPDVVDDAKIAILLKEQDNLSSSEALIIYGPGDYEASNILIKGHKVDGGTVYSVDVDEGKALIASSDALSKLTDEDEFDAVIIKAVGMVDEAKLSAISSKLVVVFGESQNVPESVRGNKVNKINLKKAEELSNNVVYLEKK